MRLTTRGLQLGLSLAIALTATAPGAQAADFSRGSVKDRGGVPVPAPMPVAETFKWYVRGDVGGGLVTGGDPSSRGDIYGFDRLPADGQPFGINSAWFNNGFDTFAIGGLGVGAYVGPRLRGDFTLDTRTKSNVDMDGNYRYMADPTLYGLTPLDQVRVDGRSQERIEVRDTVGLFNLYVDLAERGTRFVPYIGVGVGFAVRTIDRRHEAMQTAINSTDPLNMSLISTGLISAKAKSHQFVPAAAAQAGFAYTLDSGTVLDFSYRFAYLGAAETTLHFNTGTSRLTIDDNFEHALRAGVRWNVW